MKTKKGLICQLENAKVRIGKERDKLREVMDDYDDLLESVNRAHEALDECITTLSERT